MTTELEREILKVLDANNFGLSVYAKPGADGISRAEIMDSLPTSIGPAGELAAEEVARTMDLSREEQEAEMRAQVPALKGAATGAAVATATTIPDIIGLGYGGVKALLAKEGEKGQAFLNGLSSISGTVGSEKAGKIYAEYVGDLDATDEEKAAMMAGYQAGEFGGIPGLAGAYQLVKKGVKAAPDIIEGAGEGAKARMGGATLTSGVNPDPLIAAAGDAVAKFRAPTEKQPGVIAFHGSGADFDEFKLEKIGTGEGAQAYGYGLYFTDSESIARFYKEAMEEPKYLELEGKPLDSVYTADNEEKFADYVNKNFDPEEHDDVYVVLDNLGQGLLSLRDADNMASSTFRPTEKNLRQIYQKIKPDLVEPEVGEGKMYKVGLEPKPEDMLDYQTTFADQPKKVQDALKAIGYQVETDATGMKNAPAQVELAMKRPMPMILESLKGRITEEIRLGKQAPGQADKILSEKLLEQGVPGIKYRAAGSRGASVDAADAEMNYVIFDDKMIKILEKYGIVGPVAITGVAASQQEGESDGRSA